MKLYAPPVREDTCEKCGGGTWIAVDALPPVDGAEA